MISNDTNPEASLSRITKDIAKMLPGLYLEMRMRPKQAALGESFSIAEIDTLELQQSIESGKFPARETAIQHHQILIDGDAKAYALSERSSSGVQQVFKVVFSDIAKRIDQAIERLESDTGPDTRVLLLKTRAFWVYAFWLVSREQVYLISVPSRFKILSERLRAEPYLNQIDFIRLLYDEIKHLTSKPKYAGDLSTFRL
jgi:hypothetical protein